MSFSTRKFIDDLREEVVSMIVGGSPDSPAAAYDRCVAAALLKQIDPVTQSVELTRGQKAARTRKKNAAAAARKANSGAQHEGDAAEI